ncbi:hepatic lectin [Protobothrops mucrosquamatus]|uniref:hepatic lectin n=1 Tax=Protobothrops mucrosquamatus TaxID=103944 RepID=UPI0007757064|nr:hepatic lectin [Protobothrops mucrosquamatus]
MIPIDDCEQQMKDQEYLTETRTNMPARTIDRFIPQWKWTSTIIYVLLAISYLLIIILFGLVASQGRSKWDQHLENLYPCGAKSREWKHFDGACYFFSVTQVIWHTAKSKCEEENSELVVITNQYEQNFLETETRSQRFWIGLSDHNTEGQWRWVDNTDYRTSFKNWLEGEPNDNSNNEDCGELYEAGKWNDVSCNTKKFYVCKKPLPP